MTLYIDIHKKVPGVTVKTVAEAHQKDLKVQGKYKVKYLKYWVDVKDEKVFCLMEAPNKQAAEKVHREAHGLLADELYEVSEGI